MMIIGKIMLPFDNVIVDGMTKVSVDTSVVCSDVIYNSCITLVTCKASIVTLLWSWKTLVVRFHDVTFERIRAWKYRLVN